MYKLISRFAKEEAGAVSADFVVLTAAMVGFGIAVITIVHDGAVNQSTSLGNVVGDISVEKN